MKIKIIFLRFVLIYFNTKNIGEGSSNKRGKGSSSLSKRGGNINQGSEEQHQLYSQYGGHADSTSGIGDGTNHPNITGVSSFEPTSVHESSHPQPISNEFQDQQSLVGDNPFYYHSMYPSVIPLDDFDTLGYDLGQFSTMHQFPTTLSPQNYNQESVTITEDKPENPSSQPTKNECIYFLL
ncbi:unnamed protein product [Meloidogyne enterolobii]|uniref:Uncharacterized protein n=1 Tax=Meloidogyne enterolobii TaxID=390850 RepID=A0ACB0Z257_MELEN